LKQLAGFGVTDLYFDAFPHVPFGLRTTRRPKAMVECRLAVRASWFPEPRRWQIEPGDYGRLIQLGTEWVEGLPGRKSEVFIEAGMLASAVPAAEAARWFKAAADAVALRPGGAPILAAETESGAFRLAMIDPDTAYFSLAEGSYGGEDFDWSDPVRRVRDYAWDNAPELTRSGFVKRAWRWQVIGSSTLTNMNWIDMPRGSNAFAPVGRLVEDSAMPDAFGIMIMPMEWAARIPPSAGWKVTSTRLDLALVEHDDLAPWFAEDRPSADVIEHARSELRPVLADYFNG
jgi:hypothetical protein